MVCVSRDSAGIEERRRGFVLRRRDADVRVICLPNVVMVRCSDELTWSLCKAVCGGPEDKYLLIPWEEALRVVYKHFRHNPNADLPSTRNFQTWSRNDNACVPALP